MVRDAPECAPVTRFAFAQTGANPIAVDAQSRDLTITPDGLRVIYKGLSGNNVQLFVRPLDALDVTALMPVSAQRAPFTSPDGQWVGFTETIPIRLMKVPITGGPPQMLSPLDGASRGATWSEDGTSSSPQH